MVALRLETTRLILRPPRHEDLDAIFARYASDVEVTRYVGFPRHISRADTEAFLDFSQSQWRRWPAGPMLIESRATGALLGSTGLDFETEYRASAGYVLARDSWGHGFATEALHAMVEFADTLGLQRLYALCHVHHVRSARVLERGGLQLEGTLRRHMVFPNMADLHAQDVLCYSRIRGNDGRMGEAVATP
jgi:ribosomal-protein-alanine N-acetyltransferase